MENQHRKIKGYRDLSQEEIDLMNRIKSFGPELKKLCEDLSQIEGVDHRWLAIGKTHLQEGLMTLTRGVARPDFF
jgi:hypothetical protein